MMDLSSALLDKTDPQDNHRALIRIQMVVLVIAGLAVFANSLQGAFIGEDFRFVSNHSLHGPFAPRPMAAWSLDVNFLMSQDSPWSYHLTNIVLHILAGLTLFGLVLRTLRLQDDRPRLQQAAPWLAFLGALLWLIHPLQTHCLTYLSERAMCLMGLFYVFTFYCVVRGSQEKHRAAGWYSLAILASILGMGTHEAMVSAPLLALGFDRIYLSGSFAELWRRRRWLYAGLFFSWAVLTLPFLGGYSLVFGQGGLDSPAYALTQTGVVLHYLRLTCWPVGLCFDYYDWPLTNSLADVVLPCLVLGSLLLLTLAALFRQPKIGFLGLWFFLTLAPTSSFFPSTTLASEERMYLPLAACAVLFVLGGYALVVKLEKSVSLAPALSLALALPLGYLTVQRNWDYESVAKLWEATVQERPDNFRARLLLGDAYLHLGQNESAQAQYRLVLDSPCDIPRFFRLQALRNFAISVAAQALPGENPKISRRRMAMVRLVFQGPVIVASKDKPSWPMTLNKVGIFFWSQEDGKAAALFFRQAVIWQPEEAQYHFNLALVLEKRDQAKELQEGLQLDPNYGNRARERAWKSATAANPMERNAMLAIFLAKQALQIQGTGPEVLDTLAAAYASARQFKEAVTTAEQARRLAQAANNAKLTGQIDERLALYRNKKSYSK
jgi:Tfp pilus assembly protein PilF